MKKYFQIIISICILLTAAIACNTSATATPETVSISPEVEAEDMPFAGLWMSETETLVFTKSSLYRVISNAEIGQANEQFAEIIAFDPLNNHITLRTQWIRVNGKSVGFDAPTYTLTYQINGDALQIGRGTETEFTTQLDPMIYQRK